MPGGIEHRRIVVHTTLGNEYTLSVDHDGTRPLPRTYEEEDHGILHFGRTEDGEWFELRAFPLQNVEYFGLV